MPKKSSFPKINPSQRKWIAFIAGVAFAWFAVTLYMKSTSRLVENAAIASNPSASQAPRVYVDEGSVVPVQTYERSLRPRYEAGTIPFGALATVTPPNALGFYERTADATGGYEPQLQQFYARDDPSIRFAMPTFAQHGFGEFVRVGLVWNKSNENQRLPLFGRPKYPGGNRFEYYVLDDSRYSNPLGLDDHNGLELENGNIVAIPGYQGEFFVHIF